MDPPPVSEGNPTHEPFRLEILNQNWLVQGDQAEFDTCSHGAIRAVIGGAVVSGVDAEYGISQSALALLRTVELDHGIAPGGIAEYLVCHGCGYPYSLGCSNFGTDWVVEHRGDDVLLRNARHYDTSGRAVFDVQAHLPLRSYAREVARFARAAREFYMGAPPRRMPDDERSFHEAFWREFGDRLATASNISER